MAHPCDCVLCRQKEEDRLHLRDAYEQISAQLSQCIRDRVTDQQAHLFHVSQMAADMEASKSLIADLRQQVERMTAENDRLNAVVKDYGDQITAARKAREASDAIEGGIIGWAVNCPPSDEFDIRIVPDEDDARLWAENFNDSLDEGEERYFPIPLCKLSRATTAESELSRAREAVRVLGRWINRQRRGSRGVSYIEFQDDMKMMDSAVDCNPLAAAAVKEPPTQHTPSVGA